MAKERRDRIACEDVFSGLIDQARMQVHAGARPVVMRFCHECRMKPVVLGGGFDGALQQQSVQGGGDRIGLVLQIDFELRRTATPA